MTWLAWLACADPPACPDGAAERCHARGIARRDALELPDAAVLFDAACLDGHRASCTELGAQLLAGRGIRRDEARGVEVLGVACDAGELQACARLADAYRRGIGVRVDPGAAEAWFRKASGARVEEPVSSDPHRRCWLGAAEGCVAWVEDQLARGGMPSPQARGAVAEHLALGCRLGAVEACRRLAVGSLDASLGPPDPEASLGWAREGCRMLDRPSCLELLRADAELPVDDAVLAPLLARWCAEGVGEACVRARAR